MRIIFLLLFFLPGSVVLARIDFNAKISANDARYEADLVYRLLQEHVVELYAYQDSIIFLEGKNKLVSGKDSISMTHWYWKLKSWVASLHLNQLHIVRPERELQFFDYGFSFFPGSLTMIDERLFVNKVPEDSKLNVGDEVLSLNGKSPAEWIAFLRDIAHHEGLNPAAGDWIFSGGHFFKELAACGFSWSDFVVNIRRQRDGQEERLELGTDIFWGPFYHEEPNVYDKEISFGDQHAVMRLNYFYDFKSEENYQAFFDKAFKRMEKCQTKHLVIDLRLNLDFNMHYASGLLQYLVNESFRLVDTVYFKSNSIEFLPYSDFEKKHLFLKELEPSGKYFVHRYYDWLSQKVYEPKRKHHFSGKVYVLCSERTSNGAAVVLHLLHKMRPDAIFIGRSPNTAAQGFSSGMTPFITLPYSRLKLRLPLCFFRCFAREDIPFGYSLTPQILTKPEWSERDVELDTAMYLIRQLKP